MQLVFTENSTAMFLGRQTYEEAAAFIRSKFEEKNRNANRNINVHETCATDTNQVKVILDSVLHLIIDRNMAL